MSPTVVELLAAAGVVVQAREALTQASAKLAQVLRRVPLAQHPSAGRGIALYGLYGRGSVTQYSGEEQPRFLDDFTRSIVGPVTHVARREGVWLLFDATGSGPVGVYLVYESLRFADVPSVRALLAQADRDDKPATLAQVPTPRTAPPAFLQGGPDDEDDA